MSENEIEFHNSIKDQEIDKYSLWDVLLVFLLLGFIEIIFYLFFPRDLPFFYIFARSFCYVAMILAWTLKYRKWSKADLGLVNLLDEKNFWNGVGVGLFLAFVFCGIDTGTIYLLLHQPKLTLGSIIFLMLWLPIVTIASALEEVIYRGFLFTLLKKRLGLFAGIVLSSLVFSLSHTVGVADSSIDSIYTIKIIAYIQKFVLGVVFAFFFARTGSLLCPTLTHIVFNWFVFIVYVLAYHSE